MKLLRRIVELLESIDAKLDERASWSPPPRPSPLSEPVDFGAMSDDLAQRHAHYSDDDGGWNRYL